MSICLRGRGVYEAIARAEGYRPAGTSDMYRELVVPLTNIENVAARLVLSGPDG